jgi:hypothetical protein
VSEEKQKPDYLYEVVKNTNTAGEQFVMGTNLLPNLTTQFTNDSLNAVISQNQGETVKGSGEVKTLPDKNDVEKIISEIIDKNTSAEIIDISKIRVNEKNTKEVQLAYLLFIDYLLKDPKDFPKPSDDSVPEFFRISYEGFKKKVDLLSVIYVPPSWVNIHQKILQFLTDQKNIYFSLASGSNDPLRFIIATKQILLSETEQQIEALKVMIRERAYEEKII